MTQSIPSYVPPKLARDFSIFDSPGMQPTHGSCPYKAMASLRDEPCVIYAPNPGHHMPSHWVLNRAEDIRAVPQNPDVFSRQLREKPETIPAAIEEFLRLYGNVTTRRWVKQYTDIAGVKIKAGERVSFSLVSGNRPPHEVPDPDNFRLDRGNKPHFTFGAGKHRCMGSHLARTEMAIFLGKFFEIIPQFRIKEGTQPLAHGGGVFGIKEMHLAWGGETI